ncbi:hypothetical protein D3P07_00920 [Paenibacillus sp. 1011MAR3C5]|uniref:hypothetical protein n=1 Tax=Paenibacillus sp. 1011MAR3C5 TaxID=1675787 RepID=UPI000E6C8DD3|nr:hypothetical protein [Paenibacillus sp. 1011MAR3C5]RJE90700.1 hypothetical protein D3P07_00920 [Paenibacillus sp. 1011MAR3C5]
MRASKFPVTYNGEEFRVTVSITEDERTRQPRHIVKVYVVRTSAFARIKRYKRVYTAIYRNDPNEVDEVSGPQDQQLYDTTLNVEMRREKQTAMERERKTEAEAWRRFAEWDGNISVKEDADDDE